MPRRTDDRSSLIELEPVSVWSIPLYSCIMTAKATIKRVKFRFNGTDDLSSIKITEIKDKAYEDENSKPLWGVDHSDDHIFLDLTSPLWGLVASQDHRNVSVYTIRAESLYLPGRADSSVLSRGGTQNLPGADFYRQGLKFVFNMGLKDSETFDSVTPDYTGRMNLAMYRRWKRLSKTAETTPKILNLIWTDFAANAVVGTRGLHGARMQCTKSLDKRDTEKSELSSNTHPVKLIQRRALYRWPYAIPALIVLFLTILIAFITLGFTLMGRASMSRMRQYLNKTSQGRIFTTHLYDQKNETSGGTQIASHKPTRSSTKRWVENKGKNPVTVAEGKNESLIIEDPREAQAQPLLRENLMMQGESSAFHGHE